MYKVRLVERNYDEGPEVKPLSDFFEATQEELDLLSSRYEVELVLTKELALQNALEAKNEREESQKRYEAARKKAEEKRLLTAASRKKKQLEKLKAELGE